MERNNRQVNKLKSDFLLRRELDRLLTGTTALRTIYIGTSGVDAAGVTGTSTDPFATLPYVWNTVVPPVVNHLVQIIFQNGTYNVTSGTLGQKIGAGSITVSGNPGQVTLDCVSLYTPFILNYVYVPTTIRYFTILDAFINAITVNGGVSHTINDNTITDSGNNGILVNNKGIAIVQNNTISGSAGAAIRADGDSYVSSNTNTGANVYGLRATLFGKIAKTSTQPTGSTANEDTATGGSIL